MKKESKHSHLNWTILILVINQLNAQILVL